MEISIGDDDLNMKKNGNKQKITHAYILSHGFFGKILYQLCILSIHRPICHSIVSNWMKIETAIPLKRWLFCILFLCLDFSACRGTNCASARHPHISIPRRFRYSYLLSKLVRFGFKSMEELADLSRCFTSLNETNDFCFGSYKR
jgi:hypothetical protein